MSVGSGHYGYYKVLSRHRYGFLMSRQQQHLISPTFFTSCLLFSASGAPGVCLLIIMPYATRDTPIFMYWCISNGVHGSLYTSLLLLTQRNRRTANRITAGGDDGLGAVEAEGDQGRGGAGSHEAVAPGGPRRSPEVVPTLPT